MSNNQNSQQPAIHPINLGALIGAIGALEQDPAFARPDDAISKLQLAALVSIAFDLRRLAEHQTRQVLMDASMFKDQESETQEAQSAEPVAQGKPEPVAA